MLGLGTVALMGLPEWLRPGIPRGPIEGVVVDERGFGIAGAALFLFETEGSRLAEETRSDPRGRFAFQQRPHFFDVYARPPEESGRVGAWALSRSRSTPEVALVLRTGRVLTVRAVDERGRALPGAEVRAYDRRGEAVVSRAFTDRDGRSSLLAAAQTHLAVFDPDTGLARWRLDLGVPEEGGYHSVQIPEARSLSGRVRDRDGPLEGIVVITSEEGAGAGWNGFALSDAEGNVTLPVTSRPTLVRALDPDLAHLPVSRRLEAGARDLGEIVMDTGEPLAVHTARGGSDLVARVWAWCPACATWSWGRWTDELGMLSLRVSSRFALFAEPLDPIYGPLEAWDLEYDEPYLELRGPDG